MSRGLLAVEVEGAVGHLVLNRADRLNALSTALLAEIADAAEWFDARPEVRVVIVAGRGRAFCAGVDVHEIFGGAAGDVTTARPDGARLGRVMADAVMHMKAVTVARLHGHVVGGGVVLAAACDLRVAAADTMFSIPEIDLGIPLVWGGLTRLLAEIGPAATRDLVLSGRRFDASEALRIGLVTRVVPTDTLDAAVDDVARTVAAKPWRAVEITKRMLRFGPASLADEETALAECLADREAAAVRAAYLDRLSKPDGAPPD